MRQYLRHVANILDRPRYPVLLVALLYGTFVLAVLNIYSWDCSLFVRAGGYFCDVHRAPFSLNVIGDSYGYDGQFYYRLALDPFTSEKFAFGVSLDSPQYRHQRVLYPLIVWLVTGGGYAPLVPAAMILVNFVAVCSLGWTGGLVARRLGRHCLWGSVLALSPGLVGVVQQDLTEATELAFLCGAVAALLAARPTLAGVLLGLAVLAKEPALLFAVAAGGVWLVPVWRRASHVAALTWVIPLACYVGWDRLWLPHNWPGASYAPEVGQSVGWPLQGVIRFFVHPAHDHQEVPPAFRLYWSAEFVAFFAVALGAGFFARRSTAPPVVKAGWLLYGALTLFLTRAISEGDAVLRTAAELFMLSTVILLAHPTRRASVLLVFVALFWLAVAGVTIWQGSWVPVRWGK